MQTAEQTQKNKGGRPQNPPHLQTRPRQLGRWTDADWETLRQAAQAERLPIATWARRVLLREATRLLRRQQDAR